MADEEQEQEWEMVGVASTNLAAVGYKKGTSELRVEFLKSGAVYQYDGVPEGVYNEIITGSSAGEAFDSLVKKGGYAYRRIA
jgi:hypothetical protein